MAPSRNVQAAEAAIFLLLIVPSMNVETDAVKAAYVGFA
jgi:hypothetical protein